VPSILERFFGEGRGRYLQKIRSSRPRSRGRAESRQGSGKTSENDGQTSRKLSANECSHVAISQT
jgi:hypothetical protein